VKTSADTRHLYDFNYYLTRVEGWREHKNMDLDQKRASIIERADVCGKKVLDVGFGRGDVLLRCFWKGADCVGIDYSESAMAIARRCCPPAVRLYLMAVDGLREIREDGFQVVFLLDVLEHISDGEALALARALGTICAAGCRLHVVTPVDVSRGDYKGMHINQWDVEKVRETFSGWDLLTAGIHPEYDLVMEKRE